MLRVAASYAVIAWLVLQIASVVFDPLGVPKWVMTALVVVAIGGFPIAVALAWFLETGARGVELDTAADGVPRPSARGLRHFADAIVIGVLVIAVVILFVRQSDIGKPKPPANPAIAVLPFENETGDPDQEYFSDGLADEILDRLGRVPGLRVIARSSSFSFKGNEIDAKAVAERLGVTTVLEGSVRRDGKRLRLSARLIDGATGLQSCVWQLRPRGHRRFRRPGGTGRAVVDAIIPSARGAVRDTTPRPTSDMNAYDLYLIGKQGQWQRSRESVLRAVNALQRSVELDPKYAPAYAQLSLALLSAVSYAGMSPKEAFPKAEAAAHRAVALDTDLPEAHIALALSIASRSIGGNGDWRSLMAMELRRALELNPNSSLALFQYSRTLDSAQSSMQWLRKALQVDPLAITPRTNLIIGLHYGGDDRARDREIARFNELFNGDVDGMTMLARLCVRALDDPLCAARAARRAIQLSPPEPTPGATVYLHRALLAVGAYEEAAELQARTDWKHASPDIWAYESALAAGSRLDLARLVPAIEAVKALVPDPARAAALLYWLDSRRTVRGGSEAGRRGVRVGSAAHVFVDGTGTVELRHRRALESAGRRVARNLPPRFRGCPARRQGDRGRIAPRCAGAPQSIRAGVHEWRRREGVSHAPTRIQAQHPSQRFRASAAVVCAARWTAGVRSAGQGLADSPFRSQVTNAGNAGASGRNQVVVEPACDAVVRVTLCAMRPGQPDATVRASMP